MKLCLKCALGVALVIGIFLGIAWISGRMARGKSDTAKGTSADWQDESYKDMSDVDDLRVISHDANQLCLAQNAKGKLERPEWDTCLGILKLREQIAMRDAQAALNRSPK